MQGLHKKHWPIQYASTVKSISFHNLNSISFIKIIILSFLISVDSCLWWWYTPAYSFSIITCGCAVQSLCAFSPYRYLRLLIAHTVFGIDRTLDRFLLDKEAPPRSKLKKGIFDKFTSNMDVSRKMSHKVRL